MYITKPHRESYYRRGARLKRAHTRYRALRLKKVIAAEKPAAQDLLAHT